MLHCSNYRKQMKMNMRSIALFPWNQHVRTATYKQHNIYKGIIYNASKDLNIQQGKKCGKVDKQSGPPKHLGSDISISLYNC
jgi:hypothetical protein